MDREQFVKIWNEATYLADVVEQTGYSKQYATKLARQLRDKGHDLKVFRRGPAKQYGPSGPVRQSGAVVSETAPAKISEPLAVRIALAKAAVAKAKAELDILIGEAGVERARNIPKQNWNQSAVRDLALAQNGKLRTL